MLAVILLGHRDDRLGLVRLPGVAWNGEEAARRATPPTTASRRRGCSRSARRRSPTTRTSTAQYAQAYVVEGNARARRSSQRQPGPQGVPAHPRPAGTQGRRRREPPSQPGRRQAYMQEQFGGYRRPTTGGRRRHRALGGGRLPRRRLHPDHADDGRRAVLRGRRGVVRLTGSARIVLVGAAPAWCSRSRPRGCRPAGRLTLRSPAGRAQVDGTSPPPSGVIRPSIRRCSGARDERARHERLAAGEPGREAQQAFRHVRERGFELADVAQRVHAQQHEALAAGDDARVHLLRPLRRNEQEDAVLPALAGDQDGVVGGDAPGSGRRRLGRADVVRLVEHDQRRHALGALRPDADQDRRPRSPSARPGRRCCRCRRPSRRRRAEVAERRDSAGRSARSASRRCRARGSGWRAARARACRPRSPRRRPRPGRRAAAARR